MLYIFINSLWTSDAKWWQRSGSTSAQVMAYCLMAPSHHLNQCWWSSKAFCGTHLRTISQEVFRDIKEYEKNMCKISLHISCRPMSLLSIKKCIWKLYSQSKSLFPRVNKLTSSFQTKPERPIVHNPEIFAQFASLSLEAPSNLLEVPASITMLQDKKASGDIWWKIEELCC